MYTLEIIIGFFYSLMPDWLYVVGIDRFVLRGFSKKYGVQSKRGRWQCDCFSSRIFAVSHPDAPCRHIIAVRHLMGNECQNTKGPMKEQYSDSGVADFHIR